MTYTKFSILNTVVLTKFFVSIAVAFPDNSNTATTETVSNTTGNTVIEAKINLLEAQMNDIMSKIIAIETMNTKLAALEQQVKQNQANIVKLTKYIKSKISSVNTNPANINPTNIVSELKKTAGTVTPISSLVEQKVTNVKKNATQNIATPMLSNVTKTLKSGEKTAQSAVNSAITGISGLATSGKNTLKNTVDSTLSTASNLKNVTQNTTVGQPLVTNTQINASENVSSIKALENNELAEISGEDNLLSN